ncbi:50S ribosomal protein L9 [bacterium]|nr:50S ribosomal protein L9 [bacterium]
MAKVVLLADIPNIGKKGMIVDVKEGFAANFLFPKKLARFAQSDDEKKAELLVENSQNAARNKQKLITKLISFASSQLIRNPIKIPVKTAVGGRVFGSVDAEQVLEGLFSNMPQLKELERSEFQVKIPQRVEYAGKYVFELLVNVDGEARKDVTVIPLYVDVIPVTERKGKN